MAVLGVRGHAPELATNDRERDFLQLQHACEDLRKALGKLQDGVAADRRTVAIERAALHREREATDAARSHAQRLVQAIEQLAEADSLAKTAMPLTQQFLKTTSDGSEDDGPKDMLQRHDPWRKAAAAAAEPPPAPAPAAADMAQAVGTSAAMETPFVPLTPVPTQIQPACKKKPKKKQQPQQHQPVSAEHDLHTVTGLNARMPEGSACGHAPIDSETAARAEAASITEEGHGKRMEAQEETSDGMHGVTSVKVHAVGNDASSPALESSALAAARSIPNVLPFLTVPPVEMVQEEIAQPHEGIMINTIRIDGKAETLDKPPIQAMLRMERVKPAWISRQATSGTALPHAELPGLAIPSMVNAAAVLDTTTPTPTENPESHKKTKRSNKLHIATHSSQGPPTYQ